MAITRSQIARQLLAEGGAPRIPFRNGGGRTDANTMSGSGYGVGSSSSDDGYGGGDDVARPTYSQQLTALQDPMMQPGTTGETFPNIAKVTPKQVFGTSADNPMLYRSPLERALIQSIPIFGTAINLGEMNAFNMPAFRYSRTGGDTRFGDDEDTNGENEIIKRPLMPMVPKLPTDIEPEKSDYAEFTQRFTLPEAYRLADGGEVRQEYGLGDIVKKVTGAVKKVVKSDVGKAALLATAGAYAGGLGPFAQGSTMFGGKLAGIAGSGFARDFLGKELFKDYFIKDGSFTGKGLATLGIGATSLLAGAMTPKEEQESLSERIADRTGLDIAAIRKEVQDAYASGNTASLRNKYPFLITESAAAAEGGRIGFAEGTPQEMFPDNIDDIGPKRSAPKLRKMPEFKGDEVKPADMMMAGYGYNEAMSDTYDSYLDMKRKGLIPPTMDFDEFLQEVVPEMGKKQGIERTMVAEGGMMNLGGNEMDLRGGGFVPIGVEEKADDVPARLSKNEFVFTADAVRAAGGGSVDKGADLMYKTMKQLENKVA